MAKHSLLIFLTCVVLADPSTAQVYETSFTKNVVTVKLSGPEEQFLYQSDQLLAGFNRRRHAFVYKLPVDSLFFKWKNQGLQITTPAQGEFVEILVKTQSNPVDMANFNGENQEMECEIIMNGISYNETALFSGFYSSSDKMITTSFRIRVMLNSDNFPEAMYGRRTHKEIEIVVSDAKVVVKNDY